MAVNDIFRVDYFMTSDDRRVSVSQYYNEILISTGTQEEVTAAIAAASEVDFWTDFWKPFASDELTYVETRCQQVYPTRQAPVISTTLGGEVGAVIGNAMNGTTAVLVAQYGIDWLANFRGRMYLPGLPEGSASFGRIDATPHGLIQTAATTFMTSDITPGAPAGGGYTPVVYSPTRATAVPPVDPVWSIMGVTPVRPRIATQRRRRTNVQLVS
ncbi:unnamed protein product [marine sediment metagenome]|uniref:Uncharacterized protein n=1 Tax=marine sediment metagenome TaxID=412755 RepID=X0ZZU3_9ZZZZ